MNDILLVTLRGLKQAFSYDDIHDVLVEYARALEFPYYFYSYRPDGQDLGGDGFTGTFANNYPPEWQDEYARMEYTPIDPVYQFGIKHEGVLKWSDVPIFFDQQREMMEHAATFGLAEGVLGMIANGENRTAITMCGPEGQGQCEVALETLKVLMPCLAATYSVVYETEKHLVCLTPRERQVFMFWRHQSRARKVIAEEFSLDIRTIDRHLASCREKLPASLLA